MAAVAGRQVERFSRNELVVAADGDHAFYEMTHRLSQEAISVTELSLRLPSLDEAFFALTGARRAGDEAQAPTKAAS